MGIVPLPRGTRAGLVAIGLALVPLLPLLTLLTLLTLLPVRGLASAEQFRSGVNLVEVFATVTDEQGRPVADLTASDFVVEEDGVLQRIDTFAAGKVPLTLAVALDRSFSMTQASLARSGRAVRVLLDGLQPADQSMLVAIGSETDVLAPLSTDRGAALAALDSLTPWGTTPLYDATLEALAAIQAGAGRRALVLLSDGADRYSGTTAAELVLKARGMDVQVYPILLGRERPPLFAELASVTGGRSVHAPDDRRLQEAMASIAGELRLQYLLGYTPAPRPGGDGASSWRSIRVRVDRAGTRVRARDGYFAR